MLVQSSEYGLTIKDAKTLVALDDGDRLEYYLEVVDILGKQFSENSRSLEKVGKIASNWYVFSFFAPLSFLLIVTTEPANFDLRIALLSCPFTYGQR